MNTGAEPQTLAEPKPPGEGWKVRHWIFFIVFAAAAHLAFVFLFGAKTNAPIRAVTNVPQFHLADAGNELLALTDPTLFARPHLDNAASAIWHPPELNEPSFQWTEPAQFLTLATENLGAVFDTFMQTNRFGKARLDFKPEAQLTSPFVRIESMLPQSSTLQLSGNLAQRRMLDRPAVPTLAWNDVLAPSIVQVLVTADGKVASAVLLESSEYELADQTALKLVRAARFAPAAGLMFGEMIFTWHTVPTNAP